VDTVEREGRTAGGAFVLIIEISLGLLALLMFVLSGDEDRRNLVPVGVALVLLVAFIGQGFFVVQPNIARVLVFFGRYRGTVRGNGWHWVNPFTRRETVSLRIRNLDSDVLKVNDAVGNPVEIAAVISWQVADTAKAVFDVENYGNFVSLQTETAVRHVASQYPYDNYEDDEPSLRANADDVTATLGAELQDRLDAAGVTVLDTRLRRLAYAPEIAGEMLRRQQANAVVAARQRIVEGAVGMVQHALDMLLEQGIVELDEERKAAMVSNLLVVLCSERGAQPVVNSGSLYG
jgi:regulator of protease activity HflC (stomatin/prohibitin superfamily)